MTTVVCSAQSGDTLLIMVTVSLPQTTGMLNGAAVATVDTGAMAAGDMVSVVGLVSVN